MSSTDSFESPWARAITGESPVGKGAEGPAGETKAWRASARMLPTRIGTIPGMGMLAELESHHMHVEVLAERFFSALISGNRAESRLVVDELIDAEWSAQRMLSEVFWPTLEHIQRQYRSDQLSDLSHHYATRLMRLLIDQVQLRLEQQPRNGKRVLITCGPEDSEELASQLVADLLEASGFEIFYAGGGIANDEIVNQLGELECDILVVFGAVPTTVPETRLLIDRLHAINACPKLQIVVGGGVFNRADGLAEEIGADLWASTPADIVAVMTGEPDRRMTPDQRTVGRKRRTKRSAAAA